MSYVHKYDIGMFPMVEDLLRVGHIAALAEAKLCSNTYKVTK